METRFSDLKIGDIFEFAPTEHLQDTNMYLLISTNLEENNVFNFELNIDQYHDNLCNDVVFILFTQRK